VVDRRVPLEAWRWHETTLDPPVRPKTYDIDMLPDDEVAMLRALATT
jgi:hypothetical protein